MHCDVGAKKNSKGYKPAWIGYKLHVDVNDCGLPISAVLTAASLHDSQVAVQLMKMTSERIDVMVRGAAKSQASAHVWARCPFCRPAAQADKLTQG